MTDLVLPLWCLVAAIFVHAFVTFRGWYLSQKLSVASHEATLRSIEAMDLSMKNVEDLRREENNIFKASVEASTGRKIEDMTDAEVLSIVRETPNPETAT